mmetsp:Transcript_8885/g.15081  ORF Transcript_8885/g.15081 Transcript_8885/m.15081 type:complete len:110 (+) Transcript_8885:2-331(+)
MDSTSQNWNPNTRNSEELKELNKNGEITDFKVYIDFITALFEGLGLTDFLQDEGFCFENIEIMILYFIFSYKKTFEQAEIYLGFLDFFRGVSSVSPFLRKCYNFSQENT